MRSLVLIHGPNYTALMALVRTEGLHTVCQEAGCPNIYECWVAREVVVFEPHRVARFGGGEIQNRHRDCGFNGVSGLTR